MKSVSRRFVAGRSRGLGLNIGLGLGKQVGQGPTLVVYDSRAASDEPKRPTGRLTRRPCAMPTPPYEPVARVRCLTKLTVFFCGRRDHSPKLASEFARASCRGLRSQSTRRWLRRSGHAEVHCTTIAYVCKPKPFTEADADAGITNALVRVIRGTALHVGPSTCP